MSVENISLTMGQRIAACKAVAADINEGNSGLTAETWTTATPKPGTGISVFQNGDKFAIVTVNTRGYYSIRSYLKSVDPAVLAKLEPFGFTPGKFTDAVDAYQGPGKRFDTSKLAK